MKNNAEFEVMDLGEATIETKQIAPVGPFMDSYYAWGWGAGFTQRE